MKKILMVDDYRDFCEATAIFLESKGYGVTSAHDGKEGLEMIRSKRPDLVILDVMMPGMNGYDVCVVMKADNELKAIPVILLTGVGEAVFKTTYSRYLGLMTEADDYLAKPVDTDALAASVAALLG
jgi:DNA-binding response OmpR family regulator